MEEKKVPVLRFRGFDNAWEQCKFSDVVEIGSGMDYKHLGIGDIPVYGTGGYMLSVDVALSENNDAIGIGRKGTIDKPYILRAPFWTVDTLFYCIPKYNHNLDFTNCLFQNIDWKNKDESTGVPSLSKVIINSIETSIPSYEEQKKIGEYFKSFENLIILHQRKLEMLKKVKKSMLEKMFPKNDAKVPELRFSDFTDAWEQRHLGEIVERVTRKNENLESTLPLTISAQYGLIDQNEFFDKRIASKDISGYFLIRRGEFAYNKSTSTDAPWGAIKCLERYENGVLSTLYIVFRIIDKKKLNSNYLAFYYDTDLWHRGVQAIAAEGARNHGLLNIAPVDFFETTLAIPQDIFEQQKIGLFFKQLDNLISLHQRKLEKLKNIKKSMLEKMFII